MGKFIFPGCFGLIIGFLGIIFPKQMNEFAEKFNRRFIIWVGWDKVYAKFPLTEKKTRLWSGITIIVSLLLLYSEK